MCECLGDEVLVVEKEDETGRRDDDSGSATGVEARRGEANFRYLMDRQQLTAKIPSGERRFATGIRSPAEQVKRYGVCIMDLITMILRLSRVI
jgi:hypothetical protein